MTTDPLCGSGFSPMRVQRALIELFEKRRQALNIRTYVRVMQAESVQSAAEALRAAYEAMAALPVDALTAVELVGVLDELEVLTCQLPVQSHRMLARLQAETTPKA